MSGAAVAIRDRTTTILRVNEIFHSIQGESRHAGRPCVFVRLTWCNLRCAWCDTPYAFEAGEDRSIAEILEAVAGYGTRYALVTGGEPLVQEGARDLVAELLDRGYEETLRLFDQAIGLRRLRAVHVNDSKKDLGGRVDRHEHIGKGFLGLAAFRLLMNDPRLAAVPLLLETPKDDDCREDVENLTTLMGLVGGGGERA